MILTIDAGTTSMRGILFHDNGKSQPVLQVETKPRFFPGNKVEQDPCVWKKSLILILKKCCLLISELHLELDGIAVTAFRSPVFPMSKEGKALAPAIMWQDTRTDSLCREHKDADDLCYKKSGLPIRSIFSAIKMEWFRKNRPEVFKQAWKMSGIYDYLLFLLTGGFVTDYSVASRSNLFNLRTLNWDSELLKLFAINPEHLPEIRATASLCGVLTQEMAKLTGLPGGIPVITGGGDQQCASLGLGIISTGQASINTGTGAYVISLSNKPIEDPGKELFCNCAAIPGKYIIESSLLTAGTIHRWFCETFLSYIENSKERYKSLDKELMHSVPGANGILMIPDFKTSKLSGVKTETKGVFLGLDLNSNRADMARSILEGIAFELEAKVEKVRLFTGIITSLSVAGGLNNSPLYRQIQADIFEKKLLCPDETEATAKGAWMNAMLALEKVDDYNHLLYADSQSTVNPASKNFGTYRRQKNTWKKIRQRLS